MFATITSARDLVLGASPWLPGQQHYGVDSLTAEELTRALASDVLGARVDSLHVEMDSQGTTDRARLRLLWNEEGQLADLPRSAFAKGTSSHLAPRIIVSSFGCHTYESRFFTQIQPSIADLTITPYVTRAGIGGRYVVAFEDLALRGSVQMYDADDEASLAHAEAVIDLLATLHGRFWCSPRFAADLSWVETYSRRPGYPFMKRLFQWSERRFMKQDRQVPDPVRRLTKLYVGNQARFVKVWEAMPPTLCHGDSHLGNTFANPDGSAGIYDWQVFHKMNGLRDFAYFMTHSVPTELRRAHERDLLTRYLHGLANAGAGKDAPDFADAWDKYRLLTIDGWIAVVFTLAAGNMQPNDRMEVTAARAINTLLDLDVENIIAQQL